MAITGVGGAYDGLYAKAYDTRSEGAAKKGETKDAAGIRQNGGNDIENKDVSDYYSYLSKKYDCVKSGKVAIAGLYLKECAKNPAKAKELEENLSFYKESCQSGYAGAKANAGAIGARLVSYKESWSIDKKGNVTMMASTTVTSDIKGWRELKEEQEERLKKKNDRRMKTWQ